MLSSKSELNKELEEEKEGKEKEISLVQSEFSLNACYNKEWVLWLMKGEEDEENSSNNDNDGGDNDEGNNDKKRKKKKEPEKNDLICHLCKNIVNDVVELTCPEHKASKEPIIIGEQCLLDYFKRKQNDNGNQICPIGDHENCQYFKSKIAQRLVDNLMIICPLQFQLLNEQCQKKQKYPFTTNLLNNIARESATEIEGNIDDVNKERYMNVCKFKGKIKDLKKHLDECILKPVDCEFKIFGCKNIVYKHNLAEHMQSYIQHHLQLVVQKAKEQNKEIEEKKIQINDLQQKNETLNESLRGSKDQISVLQKENELLNQTVLQLKLENEKMHELQNINHKIQQETKREMEKKIKENTELLLEQKNFQQRIQELQSPTHLLQLPLELSKNFENSKYSCEEMVDSILPLLIKFNNLKNGVDYLLIENNNEKIKLKNNEWNIYKYGIFLLGENITVQCNTRNELGYLKIKTSHLWIKHSSSNIHCNALGYSGGDGPGRGGYGCGGGYGTKGEGKQGGETYGEETLLKEIHCGSGGGRNPSFFGGGGRGGGVIEIMIEQHLINSGKITCNGGDGYELGGGGGSGGSILIKFSNENINSQQQQHHQIKHYLGIIQSNGGKGNNGGRNGGSGRIAIYGTEILDEDKKLISPQPFHKRERV